MNCATTQLQDQVRSAVHADPHLARRNLHFEHCGRRVTVRGTVESYYQKQLAQETLKRIDGIEEIENRLAVRWPAETEHGFAQSVSWRVDRQSSNA
jgi:osmotically-inducible protein OsmY